MMTFKEFLVEYKNKLHRNPKTKQEMSIDDSEVKVRAKRNKKNLPSSYDDLKRGKDNSWKKYRNTQHR